MFRRPSDEWGRATVEDISSQRARAIAIGPFGSALTADMYTPTGVQVLRGTDIGPGKQLTDANPIFVSKETASRFSGAMVSEGDLVFPHRGAIGRVGLVPDGEYLLSSSMMKLTCDANRIYPEFAFYYFRGPGRHELLKNASTVGTPGIGQPLSSLRGISVPIPPMGEQRAIAEVLGALDDKVAANDAMAFTTDELVAALFTRVCASAATSPLSNIASVNVTTVKPPPSGKLRYLDIASVGNGQYESPKPTNWADAPGRARRGVQRGDTIWSTVRPNRRSHALILESDPMLVASTGLAVLTPHAGRVAGLYESTRRPEFEFYLVSLAAGSAYPAVNASRFEHAPVPSLKPNVWDSFEDLALPMRERAHAAAMESDRLVAIRDALLPLLMSGSVHVKRAEKIAEEAL